MDNDGIADTRDILIFEGVLEALLLPLLEAGQTMRNLVDVGYNIPSTCGKAWDAAKRKALE